jgi:putative phosphonate catabolism associated alcohol dehydrogenase
VIPATASFVAFLGPGQPQQLRVAPLPELGPGELLVRIACATLCRSDLSTWSGARTETTPTILGHEMVGHLAAFGPNAPRHDLDGAPLATGDRITWAIYAADPAAPEARAGMPQKAAGRCKYGHEPLRDGHGFHGGLAEWIVLRRHTPVVRVPAAVPDVVAALLNCAGASMAGALRLCGDVRGKTVLVSGLGALGLFGCAMARVAGADVVGVDPDPARVALAAAFGARGRLAGAVGSVVPERHQVALECSGAPVAMEQAVAGLALGGIAVFVGAVMPARPIALDGEHLVRSLLTVRGLHNYTGTDLVAAVRFVQEHGARFPFATLVEDGHRLADADRAFAHAIAARPVRVAIRPWQE